MFGAKAQSLSAGQWKYVEAVFTYDGLLNVVGNPSEYCNEEEESRFDLRIGNGYVSQSSGEH